MSQGTLFAYTKDRQHSRAITPKAIIKYFNLDITIAECAGKVYEDNFPLKKAPTFVGPNGFKLQEVMAIIFYLMNLGNPKSELLGKNPQEYALIVKWMSIVNSELLPTLANAFRPMLGKLPYNKKSVEEAIAYSEKVVSLFDKRLKEYTYLVGERLTIADIFVASLVTRGFDYLWGFEWRKLHPEFTRWFKTIIQNPILFEVIGEYKFRDKPIEYFPIRKDRAANEQSK